MKMTNKIRVLIADDNPVVVETIKQSLNNIGFDLVGVASNGNEAINMALSLNPDVILMDIEMPELDGIEASRLIQEECPTPIVILTVHESQKFLEKASKVGVGAYLMKPPQAAEIDRAITIAIARHHDLMEMHRLNRLLAETESNMENIFNTAIPICITNTDYEIVLANDAYKGIFGQVEQSKRPVKCYDSRPGPACQTDACPLQKIISGEKEVVCEPIKLKDESSEQYFIVSAKPYINNKKQLCGIVECFLDITARKKLEKERDKLIVDLQKALEEVKTLQGILPICSFCKNIRNDEGYYEQIEWYIHKHSGVDFSHTICPTCMKEHYPQEYESIVLYKKDNT